MAMCAAAASSSVRAQVIQIEEELVPAVIVDGSHQTIVNLARYETGLIRAQHGVAVPALDEGQGQLIDQPSDYLEPTVTSASGEALGEEKENAVLPVAA
jgi:hypothetical protein